MLINFKKIFFNFSFNFSMFLLLMFAIQNSSSKKQVDLIIAKTIDLPISFIMGVSFISGSLAGTFLTFNPTNE